MFRLTLLSIIIMLDYVKNPIVGINVYHRSQNNALYE